MEMEIIEMEEYLGLMRHENQSFADVEDLLESLREDKAVIDMKGLEAAEQIGEVREMTSTESRRSHFQKMDAPSIAHNHIHNPQHHGLVPILTLMMISQTHR